MAESNRVSLRSYFAPPKAGYRSVNLKLDLGNPDIIREYLPTQKSSGVLEAIFASLDPQSRERASSIIAPYGSGKSSLLLLLSALLENHRSKRKVLSKVEREFAALAPNLARSISKLRKEKLATLLSSYQGTKVPWN